MNQRKLTKANATALGVTALGAIGLGFLLSGLAHSPNTVVLRNEGRALWIRDSHPIWIGLHSEPVTRESFRKVWTAETGIATPTLTFRALRTATVSLDGMRMIEATPAWPGPIQLRLPGAAKAGRHQLEIVVENDQYGPALLSAEIAALDIATDGSWLSSADNVSWQRAALADAPTPPPQARLFPPAALALAGQLGWLLPCVGAAVACGAGLEWRRRRGLSVPHVEVGTLRWGLMAAWAALAANDYFRLPARFGMDQQGHLDYVRFIVEKGSLPLATDGWQMFQSPLYYLLAAGLYRALSGWLSFEDTARALRVLSIACGLGLVEATYLGARLVFAGQRGAQAVAVLVGALLPMNFYLCQAVGNEPLAAVLSAFTLVLALGLVRQPERSSSLRYLGLLGGLWGLALLAKVSALLLVAPIGLAVGLAFSRARVELRRAIAGIGVLSASALAISGWYYARNWWLLKTPVMAGWLPGRSRAPWWQEPGYRSLGQLGHFGEALVYPFFSAVSGFWDSLYSTLWTDAWLGSGPLPPWSYAPMVASVWLALIPTALIAAGLFSSFWRTDAALKADGLVPALAFGVYLAALLVLYLKVPIYSTAKATYTSGLTPCYGVLAAAGFTALPRHWAARSLTAGLLLGWAIAVYAGFFSL
jgi:hypothetical protein